MNGKIPEKVYVPYLLINGLENPIGTGQYPGACVFFDSAPQAEKYLQKIKKENVAVENCESYVMEFSKGVSCD